MNKQMKDPLQNSQILAVEAKKASRKARMASLKAGCGYSFISDGKLQRRLPCGKTEVVKTLDVPELPPLRELLKQIDNQ